MLIPREKPYLDKLNSYYLDIDKFIQHLQGEIGTGCIYCRSSFQEVLVYFNEYEVIRGIIQENGQHARATSTLDPILETLKKSSYTVMVYYLEPNAIYFWGQLPSFRRAQKQLNSTMVSLGELISRLKAKNFSGFVDVQITDCADSALLFFHQGERIGGSYSWGAGGLNTFSGEYDALVAKVEDKGGSYNIGTFVSDKQESLESEEEKEITAAAASDKASNGARAKPEKAPEPVKQQVEIPANLMSALVEFIVLFETIIRKKNKLDPVILLKQCFLEKVDQHPYLDPFRGQFDYVEGKVKFSRDAPYLKITTAVVDCVWQLVFEHNLEAKFRKALQPLAGKAILEQQGIVIQR